MGAVQKLATIVIFGLVGLATVLVLYMADEGNRIDAEEANLQEDAIERGIANYISSCLTCHSPAGEGYLEPGAQGTGRIGMPLGGNTYATALNQEGIGQDGQPAPGGVEGRKALLTETIRNGRGAMPAWGAENNGPLNDAQIEELVTMIQNVDWNEVYNKAVEANGGVYPSPPPAKTPAPADGGNATPTEESGGDESTVNVDMVDTAFQPNTMSIPANTDITVNLVNNGVGTHTFNIDELSVDSGDVAGGASTSVVINAAPGTYEYYCAIPGHKEAGMVGSLVVE